MNEDLVEERVVRVGGILYAVNSPMYQNVVTSPQLPTGIYFYRIFEKYIIPYSIIKNTDDEYYHLDGAGMMYDGDVYSSSEMKDVKNVVFFGVLDFPPNQVESVNVLLPLKYSSRIMYKRDQTLWVDYNTIDMHLFK